MCSYQFIRCFQILPVVPSRPSQVCAISILILSTRISSMRKPLLVINQLVKDEHNVILILVSSSKFNSLFRRFIKILNFICSSFFPGVPRSLTYITTNIYLIIARLQSYSFHPSLLCDHSFDYRSSSWRFYMVVHQGFNSFSKCSSRFFS